MSGGGIFSIDGKLLLIHLKERKPLGGKYNQWQTLEKRYKLWNTCIIGSERSSGAGSQNFAVASPLKNLRRAYLIEMKKHNLKVFMI